MDQNISLNERMGMLGQLYISSDFGMDTLQVICFRLPKSSIAVILVIKWLYQLISGKPTQIHKVYFGKLEP